MRQRSSRFVEAHFDAKAERYQRALRAVPDARNLELLPFLLLLDDVVAQRNPRDLRLADMLCGSGILTQALRGCFGDVLGMDISSGMLSFYPVGPGISLKKAALDEQTNELHAEARSDVIVSLAGLHHVYVLDGGRIDRDASDGLQAQVVSNWASALAEGGALILADITSPDGPAEFPEQGPALGSGKGSLARRFTHLEYRCRTLLQSEWPSSPQPPFSLAGYADRILSGAPHAAHCSPARWFRDVVESYGLYGHTDHFLHPARLVETVRAEGLTVEYQELPTPWIFPSLADMQFFFYEKFALGPQVDSESDMPSEARELIMALAPEYLSVTELPSGGIATGWRLGYYVIRT